MSITVPRGAKDEQLLELLNALERYQAAHPAAVIDAYRYGRYAFRVRIVDPVFAKMTRGERHRYVWPFFDSVPDETMSDLSTLLTLTPDEKDKSFASMDFDDPLPPIL